MSSKTRTIWILFVVAILSLTAFACTITPTGGGNAPFTGGDCDSRTQRLEMNASVGSQIAGGSTWEDVYKNFCLWVPDGGSRLVVTISNFSNNADLDLYIDREITELLSDTGFGEWYSNDVGATESVTINNAGGRYYVQVVSYDGSPSSFTISSTFTP
ncbi:MAG: hypothetical protein JXB85_01280 [Anaerolineales bacterium]|nr:hypothetical protein [Anaerolineales bacterium]